MQQDFEQAKLIASPINLLDSSPMADGAAAVIVTADPLAKEFAERPIRIRASTSATDGRRIVSYFGSCGVICYDLAGRELWKFEMPPATVGGNFGSGVSPILVDDVVIRENERVLNVGNTPSPAATASLNISKLIVGRLAARLT